ncbi:hypothetical protein AVEN_208470-1 [Araneus ventricosus]|uniref:Uncharacterized protein n=1 Tax=Araneus ventricosus TaxID=182803 RepID=A0A4Y2PB08_ARAVE|nr:hypothetical protein AVEN_208470-1 [Araneus ventricosus]
MASYERQVLDCLSHGRNRESPRRRECASSVIRRPEHREVEDCLSSMPAIRKRREIIPTEQYLSALERLSREIPAEDDSVAIYLDAEVTEYSDQEPDSESDVEDNPVHEECRESNSITNIIHPFDL